MIKYSMKVFLFIIFAISFIMIPVGLISLFVCLFFFNLYNILASLALTIVGVIGFSVGFGIISSKIEKELSDGEKDE